MNKKIGAGNGTGGNEAASKIPLIRRNKRSLFLRLFSSLVNCMLLFQKKMLNLFAFFFFEENILRLMQQQSELLLQGLCYCMF